MPRDARVLEALLRAVDEVNQQLPGERRLERSEATPLTGESGSLDSLGLINLIVAAEQKIQETFVATITLTDERAMSREESPFRTIGTLADYITSLLAERGDG
jgi:acyl carrier protein